MLHGGAQHPLSFCWLQCKWGGSSSRKAIHLELTLTKHPGVTLSCFDACCHPELRLDSPLVKTGVPSAYPCVAPNPLQTVSPLSPAAHELCPWEGPTHPTPAPCSGTLWLAQHSELMSNMTKDLQKALGLHVWSCLLVFQRKDEADVGWKRGMRTGRRQVRAWLSLCPTWECLQVHVLDRSSCVS